MAEFGDNIESISFEISDYPSLETIKDEANKPIVGVPNPHVLITKIGKIFEAFFDFNDLSGFIILFDICRCFIWVNL